MTIAAIMLIITIIVNFVLVLIALAGVYWLSREQDRQQMTQNMLVDDVKSNTRRINSFLVSKAIMKGSIIDLQEAMMGLLNYLIADEAAKPDLSSDTPDVNKPH